jgi:2'-5' RNA ligase
MQLYYIGLQLPEDIRNRISAAQHELFDESLFLLPLEPHITLLPPPALKTSNPDDIVAAAKKIADTMVPFTITLRHIERYKQQAIAIKVQGEALYQLQKKLAKLLPQDTEPLYYPDPVFSPHVTLAQSKRGKKVTPEHTDAYIQKLEDILPYECQISHLTIFTSTAPRQYEATTI